MSEYVKDDSTAKGWGQVSLKKRGKKDEDGAPVTADAMDEGADDGSDGEEAPDE